MASYKCIKNNSNMLLNYDNFESNGLQFMLKDISTNTSTSYSSSMNSIYTNSSAYDTWFYNAGGNNYTKFLGGPKYPNTWFIKGSYATGRIMTENNVLTLSGNNTTGTDAYVFHFDLAKRLNSIALMDSSGTLQTTRNEILGSLSQMDSYIGCDIVPNNCAIYIMTGDSALSAKRNMHTDGNLSIIDMPSWDSSDYEDQDCTLYSFIDECDFAIIWDWTMSLEQSILQKQMLSSPNKLTVYDVSKLYNYPYYHVIVALPYIVSRIELSPSAILLDGLVNPSKIFYRVNCAGGYSWFEFDVILSDNSDDVSASGLASTANPYTYSPCMEKMYINYFDFYYHSGATKLTLSNQWI